MIKKVEHACEIGSHNTAMASARYLNILMLDTESFEFCNHRSGAFNWRRCVGIPVDHEFGNGFHLGRSLRRHAAGKGCKACPDFRILWTQVPGAGAAHRMASDVNAIAVDPIVLLHEFE